jgi:hypothetical protein
MATQTLDIAGQSLAHGGGTFAHDGTVPTTGYAVAVRVLGTPPTLNNVDLYLHMVEPGRYLGTWWDHENEVWEVDETAVFEAAEDALMLARLLGERYVYDLSRGEEIAA